MDRRSPPQLIPPSLPQLNSSPYPLIPHQPSNPSALQPINSSTHPPIFPLLSMHVVIAYDTPDHKRRTRIHKILKGRPTSTACRPGVPPTSPS
ncbi:MAG: hypothetical protein ACFB8W_10545 [Elainellaceae cyanobacterium]